MVVFLILSFLDILILLDTLIRTEIRVFTNTGNIPAIIFPPSDNEMTRTPLACK